MVRLAGVIKGEHDELVWNRLQSRYVRSKKKQRRDCDDESAHGTPDRVAVNEEQPLYPNPDSDTPETQGRSVRYQFIFAQALDSSATESYAVSRTARTGCLALLGCSDLAIGNFDRQG